MKWKNLIVVAIVSLPFFVALAMAFGTDPRAVPSVMGGKPAPACTLKDLQGKSVNIKDMLGKPTVVNFWATWCGPCEAEHGLLQVAASQLGADTQFLGVVYQDTADNARAYLAEKGSSYTQLIDDASQCAIEYGVAGVPETFFIDRAGIIRHKEVGPVSTQTLARVLKRGREGGVEVVTP